MKFIVMLLGYIYLFVMYIGFIPMLFNFCFYILPIVPIIYIILLFRAFKKNYQVRTRNALILSFVLNATSAASFFITGYVSDGGLESALKMLLISFWPSLFILISIFYFVIYLVRVSYAKSDNKVIDMNNEN